MIAIISIFASLIGNIILYRIYSSRQIRFHFQSDHNGSTSVTAIFLINKINGFVILGLIPGILVFSFFSQHPAGVGLSLGLTTTYWYLLGIPLVVIGLNYFLANNRATFNRYPEMRFKEWSKTQFAITAIGWAIYLLGYEFLFRGLLFFSVYHSYGLIIAMTLNVFIYSIVHIPKGKAEMIGAIPFGILLCSLSLLTNSIILPFLIHLCLALSTDFFSIHHNPDMKFSNHE